MAATLKCDTIQNASSSTANLTLDASGNATVGNTLAMGSSFRRNRIINGDMRVDQRNAGASVTPTANAYTLDRWDARMTQASKYSVIQSTTVPDNTFTNSILATSTSAYSVLSSDNFGIQQVIEGFNSADLAWGTSGAKSITISFWARSSITGTNTYAGSIRNNAADRSYIFTYTLAQNTWTYVTITVPGPTSGTWLTNNSGGIYLQFSLGTGSSFNTTAGAWQTGNFLSVSGAQSIVGTNGATFYITGVQLEVGSVATPYERQIYSEQLAQCQRYYNSTGGIRFACAASSTTRLTVTLPISPPLRTTPSLTMNLNQARKYDATAVTITGATFSVATLYNSAIDIHISNLTSITDDAVYSVSITAKLDAEL